MRDNRTVGLMRTFEKDIADTRRLAERAMRTGTTTRDFDAKLAVSLDLAQEALTDETIQLPSAMGPDQLRSSVSDFYGMIWRAQRSAELAASCKSGNSVTRFATRNTTPAN